MRVGSSSPPPAKMVLFPPPLKYVYANAVSHRPSPYRRPTSARSPVPWPYLSDSIGPVVERPAPLLRMT